MRESARRGDLDPRKGNRPRRGHSRAGRTLAAHELSLQPPIYACGMPPRPFSLGEECGGLDRSLGYIGRLTRPRMPWRDEHASKRTRNCWLASHAQGQLPRRSGRVREVTFNTGGFAAFEPTRRARCCLWSSDRAQPRVPLGRASVAEVHRRLRAAITVSAARSAPSVPFPHGEAPCPGHRDSAAARAAREAA